MPFSRSALSLRIAAWLTPFVLSVGQDAWADQLVLVDGQVLEGIVTMKGEQVTIRLDVGTIGFDLKDVKEIRQGDSLIAELEKRRRQIAAGDVGGLRHLATWADAKGLTTQAVNVWEDLLVLVPDDEQARQRLGHQRVDGRWLTEDEAMAAKGMVRIGGVWRTAAEAAQLERELAERREEREAERTRRDRAWADEGEPGPQDRFPQGQVRVRGYPPYQSYDESVEPWDQLVAPYYYHPFELWPGGYRNISKPRTSGGKLPRPAARTPPKLPIGATLPGQPAAAPKGGATMAIPTR
jgi:hypothetical protein